MSKLSDPYLLHSHSVELLDDAAAAAAGAAFGLALYPAVAADIDATAELPAEADAADADDAEDEPMPDQHGDEAFQPFEGAGPPRIRRQRGTTPSRIRRVSARRWLPVGDGHPVVSLTN